MNDLATIAIVGRLGRDADLKYLPDGTPALKFSLAANRYEKGAGDNNQATDWWDIDMIGKRAESVAQYLTKGKQVAVQGAPALRKGKGRDGVEKIFPTIKANEVQLLGGRDSSDHARPEGSSARQEQARRDRAEGIGSTPPPDDFTDDIPF